MGFKKGKARESLSIGRLEEVLGWEHPVRLMDLLVEKVVPHLSEQINEVGHNEVGASAYNRKSLLKLYIYGYYNGIQSSRKLEQETHRNLEVIWLLEDLRPDHKTISDFRKVHGDQIRQVVRHFSWFLKDRAYLEATEISIDGIRLKANTNRDTLSEEKIDKRLGRLNRQITIYLDKLELNDAIEDKESNLEWLAVEERKALEMIAQLQGEIEELLKKKAHISSSGKKHVNFTDPEASLIKSRNGHMPQYNVQSMVCGKHYLIAATHVSDQVNDKQHLEPMTQLVEQQLDIEVNQLNADSDYYAMSAIEELEAQGKEVYVAVSEAGQKKVVDQQGQPVTFVYDAQQDQYQCSQGRILPLLAKGVIKNGHVMNQYRSADCSGCPLRQACTTSKIGRTIYRHENAEWIEAYKRKMKSARGKHMLKRRRTSVEHPFGTMRCWMMGPVPILLRGRSKVQTEIQLYQLGYNFKRVYNIASAEVLRYQMENYDWKAAAVAMKKADERRKGQKTPRKAA